MLRPVFSGRLGHRDHQLRPGLHRDLVIGDEPPGRKRAVHRADPDHAAAVEFGRAQGAELNLVGTERLKSVLAHLCWLLPLAALVFHFNARLGVLDSSPWHLGRWLMGFGVASGLAYVWLNREFLALLYRAGGLKTMVLGLGLHWMYHCYASVTFALVMLRQKLTPSTVGNAAPAINPMPPQAPPR